MALVMRRFLAVLAGSGLAASIVAYLGSFRGVTLNSFVPWTFILHAGVFLLIVPMMLIEYSSFSFKTPGWIWFSGGSAIERGSFSWKNYAKGAPLWEESFFWKEFSRGMPKWVVPTIKVLGLFFLLQFILLLVHNDAAKTAELRMFAAGWVFFYIVSMVYWWFPRNRQG
jgi:hypothetical protein